MTNEFKKENEVWGFLLHWNNKLNDLSVYLADA